MDIERFIQITGGGVIIANVHDRRKEIATVRHDVGAAVGKVATHCAVDGWRLLTFSKAGMFFSFR